MHHRCNSLKIFVVIIIRINYFAKRYALRFPTRNCIGCVPPFLRYPVMFLVFITDSIYLILANEGVKFLLGEWFSQHHFLFLHSCFLSCKGASPVAT